MFFFALMTSYGVLKPVREAMGLTGGVDRLPWLFTGTMVAMILVNPLFAWVVTRTRRRTFLPLVYGASIASLLALWIAFEAAPATHEIVVAYAFYVFVSVFNLFAVSVFWGFMADVWTLEAAKRLYGILAAAGTAGMIVGPLLSTWLARPIGAVNLILVSVGFLSVALACLIALLRRHRVDREPDGERTATRGAGPVTAADVFRGFEWVGRRPYLRWIAAYVFLHGLLGTYLYLQLQNLVAGAVPTRDAQTEFFGTLNVWEQSVTVFVQVFLTSRLIRGFGLTFALVTQPTLALLGWCALAYAMNHGAELGAWGLVIGGLTPALTVASVVQVLLRASNYGTVRPAREALFTVVEREVKYKSKSFVDTFVFRFGDACGGWTFKLMQSLSLSLPAIAAATIPLTIGWIVVGKGLGRRQRELTDAPDAARVPSASAERA